MYLQSFLGRLYPNRHIVPQIMTLNTDGTWFGLIKRLVNVYRCACARVCVYVCVRASALIIWCVHFCSVVACICMCCTCLWRCVHGYVFISVFSVCLTLSILAFLYSSDSQLKPYFGSNQKRFDNWLLYCDLMPNDISSGNKLFIPKTVTYWLVDVNNMADQYKINSIIPIYNKK